MARTSLTSTDSTSGSASIAATCSGVSCAAKPLSAVVQRYVVAGLPARASTASWRASRPAAPASPADVPGPVSVTSRSVGTPSPSATAGADIEVAARPAATVASTATTDARRRPARGVRVRRW